MKFISITVLHLRSNRIQWTWKTTTLLRNVLIVTITKFGMVRCMIDFSIPCNEKWFCWNQNNTSYHLMLRSWFILNAHFHSWDFTWYARRLQRLLHNQLDVFNIHSLSLPYEYKLSIRVKRTRISKYIWCSLGWCASKWMSGGDIIL